jgi:thiamine-monophosphate kinase
VLSKRSESGGAGELALLRHIRGRAAGVSRGGLSLGIGDDCALIRLRPREELAVTTDLSIAGRHFRLDWHPPESVGHRALARGLSDLAAMGARPVAAFLSLGLPRELTAPAGTKITSTSWMSRFLDGLLALAVVHGAPLAGGDLSESPLAVADIVLTGAVPRGQALLRSGARAGDNLYVTGSLGGAAAGLARIIELDALAAKPLTSSMRKGSRRRANLGRQPGKPALTQPLGDSEMLNPLLAPHLFPQPRIAQGLVLRRLASAAIDLSDGLSTDLAHLCEESGVAAEIDAAALPIYPGATLDQALDGGEDYELLFTARAAVRIPKRIGGVRVTRIGRILTPRQKGSAISLVTPQGPRPLNPHGWQHFT